MIARARHELPSLELGLWVAAVVLLVVGLLTFLFAEWLDSADNRFRRRLGNNRPGKPGHNRRLASVFWSSVRRLVQPTTPNGR